MRPGEFIRLHFRSTGALFGGLLHFMATGAKRRSVRSCYNLNVVAAVAFAALP